MNALLGHEDVLEEAAAWLTEQRPASIQRLVAEGERVVGRRLWPHAATALRVAAVGSVVRVPFALVRPGQAQISYLHVRSHVVKFVQRLSKGAEDLNTVTRQDMPGVIGPGGRSVLLRDRNHNFAGLLALVGWINREASAGELAPAPLADLAEALHAEDGPSVAVRVQENHAGSTAREFARAMSDRLFLERLNGSRVDEVPDRFADLEDNPARELVARVRAKIRPSDSDGTFDLSTKDMVLWVKGPSAPEFVEFHIAKIVGGALKAAGRPYDGIRTISRIDEEIMRDALVAAAADPAHESRDIFASIAVVPHELRDRDDLRAALTLDRNSGAVRLRR